jgi:hypothetical protein
LTLQLRQESLNNTPKELNGTTLVTGVTAIGQYTVSTFSLSATSITLFLNN